LRRLDLVDDPEEPGITVKTANTIRYILTIRSLYRNYFTRNPSKI